MSDCLPTLVIENILHKLPIKSLVKCTSVCKSWYSLITDQSFICNHLTQGNANPSFFLQLRFAFWDETLMFSTSNNIFSVLSSDHNAHKLSILEFPLPRLLHGDDLRMVGTCNGLVCFANYSVLDNANVIIWNPAIHKYVVLPKPTLTLGNDYKIGRNFRVLLGFGFDSRNKDFKVVRLVTNLCNNKQNPPLYVEVYSLATRSWRSINAASARDSPFGVGEFVWEEPSQMFVNGVLHWLVNSKSDDGSIIHNFILTFDVVEERFGELVLPQCLKESNFEVRILSGGNSLAVFHGNYICRRFYSIWVMKEYGDVNSWTLLFRSDSTSNGCIPSVIGIMSSGEVLLRSNSDGIVLVDPVKKSVENLGGFRGFINASDGNYVESLFLINQKMQLPTFNNLESSSSSSSNSPFASVPLFSPSIFSSFPPGKEYSFSKVDEAVCKYLEVEGEY